MLALKHTHTSSLANAMTFLYRFAKNPRKIGAIFPSSDTLAQEMVAEIPSTKGKKKRILEIGPGTGRITNWILKRMHPEDELHLVEVDPKFCTLLHQKYQGLPQVKVFSCSILDHQLLDEKKYDFIVSGLPLHAFELSFVESIFQQFHDLAKKGAKLSYFDYVTFNEIKKFVSLPAARQNSKSILSLKDQFFLKYGIRETKVLKNVPAARVRHHVLSPCSAQR